MKQLEKYFDISKVSTEDNPALMFAHNAILLIFKEGQFDACLDIYKKNADMQGSTIIDDEHLFKYKKLPDVAFISIIDHSQAKENFDGAYECITRTSPISGGVAFIKSADQLLESLPAKGKRLAILVAGTSKKQVFERYGEEFYVNYIIGNPVPQKQ